MHLPVWRIERALAASLVRHFRGTVWRVHWREVAPTDWSLSLRSTGRYHRGMDLFPEEQAFPALYTSLAPEIAIWEMVRRSAARNLKYLESNVLSELEVDLSYALDLSDPTMVDLTLSALTDSDRSCAKRWLRRRCPKGSKVCWFPRPPFQGSTSSSSR